MPKGHKVDGYVFKLNKYLYRLHQSPVNVFEHITTQIKSVGFRLSRVDPCMFIRKYCICISYVDTILVFAPNDKVIEKLIEIVAASPS